VGGFHGCSLHRRAKSPAQEPLAAEKRARQRGRAAEPPEEAVRLGRFDLVGGARRARRGAGAGEAGRRDRCRPRRSRPAGRCGTRPGRSGCRRRAAAASFRRGRRRTGRLRGRCRSSASASSRRSRGSRSGRSDSRATPCRARSRCSRSSSCPGRGRPSSRGSRPRCRRRRRRPSQVAGDGEPVLRVDLVPVDEDDGRVVERGVPCQASEASERNTERLVGDPREVRREVARRRRAWVSAERGLTCRVDRRAGLARCVRRSRHSRRRKNAQRHESRADDPELAAHAGDRLFPGLAKLKQPHQSAAVTAFDLDTAVGHGGQGHELHAAGASGCLPAHQFLESGLIANRIEVGVRFRHVATTLPHVDRLA
jgi:hypothetical protein